MEAIVPKGSYVVAVSGGVDSMVLLDLLRRQKNLDITVAHFNHGIRKDSDLDEQLVTNYCQRHQIPFASKQGKLGPDASEAEARKARYEFLSEVKDRTKSDSIITAHHKDDMLETAIINMLRGTEHRGLSSLKNRDDLLRPLLDFSKEQIVGYAKANDIEWREDSSNQDEKYLRNYVRKNLISRFSETDIEKLLGAVEKEKRLAEQIEPRLKEIKDQVYSPDDKRIKRYEFTGLPFAVAGEIMREILAELDSSKLNKKTVKSAVHFVKTGQISKTLEVSKKLRLKAGKKFVDVVLT